MYIFRPCRTCLPGAREACPRADARDEEERACLSTLSTRSRLFLNSSAEVPFFGAISINPPFADELVTKENARTCLASDGGLNVRLIPSYFIQREVRGLMLFKFKCRSMAPWRWRASFIINDRQFSGANRMRLAPDLLLRRCFFLVTRSVRSIYRESTVSARIKRIRLIFDGTTDFNANASPCIHQRLPVRNVLMMDT